MEFLTALGHNVEVKITPARKKHGGRCRSWWWCSRIPPRRTRPTNKFVDTYEFIRRYSTPCRKPRVTRSELAILQVLWEQGPATVRQVHEVLETTRGEKGTGPTPPRSSSCRSWRRRAWSTRDELSRTPIYASMPQQQTQRQLVGDLIAKAFGGSSASLSCTHSARTRPRKKNSRRFAA